MYRAALWVALIVTSLTASADYRSTFLVGGPEGFFSSSLSYLSPELDDTKRGAIRSQLRGLGDTHIDLMAWSTADDFARVDNVGSNWSNQLNTLNQSGLKPIIWMRSDDSPEIDRLPMSEQLAYMGRIVATVDDKATAYVACLECDEYYSAAQVQKIVDYLRTKTDKPIGVHLSPGMRGKEAYVANADLVYLQVGFNKTEEQFRAAIEYAVTLGKPVVVSEYSLYGESSAARRYGDIACSYAGVVGTGNGRASAVCESYKTKVEDEEWYEEYEKEIYAGLAVALVAASAYYFVDWPFKASFNYANDSGYEVMFAGPVNERLNVGATVDDQGRAMIFGRLTF